MKYTSVQTNTSILKTPPSSIVISNTVNTALYQQLLLLVQQTEPGFNTVTTHFPDSGLTVDAILKCQVQFNLLIKCPVDLF